MKKILLAAILPPAGVQPTESTYLALMEVCRHSRDSKAAVEVFEAMETEGVRPGVRSYTSLLKASRGFQRGMEGE